MCVKCSRLHHLTHGHTVIKLLNDSVQHYNRYRMTKNRKEAVYQEPKNTRTALTDESAIWATMMLNHFLLHRRLEMICQHSLIPNSSENLCDHILDTSGTNSKQILYNLFYIARIYHCDHKLQKVTVEEILNKLQTPGKRLFEAEFIIHTACGERALVTNQNGL